MKKKTDEKVICMTYAPFILMKNLHHIQFMISINI